MYVFSSYPPLLSSLEWLQLSCCRHLIILQHEPGKYLGRWTRTAEISFADKAVRYFPSRNVGTYGYPQERQGTGLGNEL